MLKSREANRYPRLSHSKQLLKMIIQWRYHRFCLLTKRYLQWPHRNDWQNDWQHAPAATKKKDDAIKRLCTRLEVQSLMAPVGESQVVDSAPVWYLLITDYGVKINEACYLNVMPLEAVRSQLLKQLLHLSEGQYPDAHGASTFLPVTLPDVDGLWKFAQSKLSSICNKVIVKGPTRHKYHTLPSEISLSQITIDVSGYFCFFSDINISQGCVEARLRCRPSCMFYNSIARNLLLSLSVKECLKSVSIWQRRLTLDVKRIRYLLIQERRRCSFLWSQEATPISIKRLSGWISLFNSLSQYWKYCSHYLH